MKTRSNSRAEPGEERRSLASTQAPAQAKHGAATFMPDARAESLAQLQKKANASTQAAQLKACADMMAGQSGAPAQRAEDEELLQGKFSVAQREEGDELLQGKFMTVQRAEDEELLQGRFDAVQRMEEDELLQGKFEKTPAVIEAPVQLKERPNNTGLPNKLKSGIESLSGMSMDHVRVHYNSDKPAQLQAHAYAQGSEIHVAPGQEQHVPHEAWHVVQQAQGRVRPTMQMHGGVAVNDDASLEGEADLMGQEALARGGPGPEHMKSASPGSAASPLQAVFVNEMGWHLSATAKKRIMGGAWATEEDKTAFVQQFGSADEATLDDWMETRGEGIYANLVLNGFVSGVEEENDWEPEEEEESPLIANERDNVENAIRTAAMRTTKKDNSGHGGGKTIPKGTKGDRHEVGQRRKVTRKKALSNQLDDLLEHYVEIGGNEKTLDPSTKKLLRAAGWKVPKVADEE